MVAIPTGFEPVTIGLEGRKPTAHFLTLRDFGLQFQTLARLRKPGAV